VKKLALKMALSSKLNANELMVLDQFKLEEIKTREFVNVLEALNLNSALIVTDEKNENLELSSRNVQDIKVLRCEGLNVYDILKYRMLVLLEPAVKNIEGRLQA
jgi:large subunit ribosomal protein L4